MCEQAKTGLGSRTKAEGSNWPFVWDWRITETFAVVVDALSDIHDAVVRCLANVKVDKNFIKIAFRVCQRPCWNLPSLLWCNFYLVSDVCAISILGASFKVNEATICRTIKRIAPLAERILKVKPDQTLSKNDLQLFFIPTKFYTSSL